MVPNLPTPASPPSLAGSTGLTPSTTTNPLAPNAAKPGAAGAGGQFDAALRMASGGPAMTANSKQGVVAQPAPGVPDGHEGPHLPGLLAHQSPSRASSRAPSRSPSRSPSRIPMFGAGLQAAKPLAATMQATGRVTVGATGLGAAATEAGSAVAPLETGPIKASGLRSGIRGAQGAPSQPVQQAVGKSQDKRIGRSGESVGVTSSLTAAPLAMVLPVPVAVTLPSASFHAGVGAAGGVSGAAPKITLGGMAGHGLSDGAAARVVDQTGQGSNGQGPNGQVGPIPNAKPSGAATKIGSNSVVNHLAPIGDQAAPGAGKAGTSGPNTRHDGAAAPNAPVNLALAGQAASVGVAALPGSSAPASSALNAPVAHPVSAQVAAALVAAGPVQADGSHHLTIALAPPAIGPVMVAIKRNGDGTSHIAVSAVDPVTLSALRNDHAGLVEALAQAGITAHETGVSFHLAASQAADAVAPMLQTAGNGGAHSGTGQHQSPGLSLGQGAMGQGLAGQSGGQSGGQPGRLGEAASGRAPGAIPVRLIADGDSGSIANSSLNLKKFGLDVTA